MALLPGLPPLTPRLRKALAAAAVCGGTLLAIKVSAGFLQNALLYHPRAIDGDPYYQELIPTFVKRLEGWRYVLEELRYSMPMWFGLGVNVPQKAYLLRPVQKEVPGASCEAAQPLASTLWVIFGGNAMLSADWLPFCESMLAMARPSNSQPAFLLIDYPGYGFNGGSPSPAAALRASRAALQRALEVLSQGQGSRIQVHILGHSLGAAAAAQLAASCSGAETSRSLPRLQHVQPGRLVLSSPFLSVDEVAYDLFQRVIPLPFLRALVWHRWNNRRAVPVAAQGGWSVSIIHPTRDEIVPVSHGRQLYAELKEANASCTMVEPPNAGHNDVLNVAIRSYALEMGLGSRL